MKGTLRSSGRLARSRGFAWRMLRVISGLHLIIAVKLYLRSLDPKYRMIPVREGRGHSVKYIASRGTQPELFIKIATPLDRLAARDAADSSKPGIRHESAGLSRLYSVGLAPEIVRARPNYYVMRYVNGPTLRQYVKEAQGRQKSIEMIALAMEAACSAQLLGVFHDGSPDNILIDGEQLLLIDTEVTFTTDYFPALTRMVETLTEDDPRVKHEIENSYPGLLERMPTRKHQVASFRAWLGKRLPSPSKTKPPTSLPRGRSTKRS